MKYKNKDGIELSYTSNDSHQVLVREVILEACKLTKMYDKDCIKSHKMALRNVRKFLKDNFDIGEL
jgi:hypothetical protein